MMMTDLTIFIILCKLVSITSFMDKDILISAEPKYILQYSNFHDNGPFLNLSTPISSFTDKNCPYQNCLVTTNEKLLEDITQFHVIAFHARNLLGKRAKPPPKQRSPRQKYVYSNMESAQNFPICTTKYNNFFNWTWTYKLDSDIPAAYISIRNMNGDIIGPAKNIKWINIEHMPPIRSKLKMKLSSKTKAGAWLVSHCFPLSDRQDYVEELQTALEKYGLQIDMYGACNNKSIPKENFNKLKNLISEKYYFYLSFENSFAPDYVTEKLLTALQSYAVPVVFGGADYSRFLPPGTYLNAGELSPKELAKEMTDIIKNKTRYFDMHKWRYHYIYSNARDNLDSDDRCKLCAMINDDDIMKKQTIVHDLVNWWNTDRSCETRLMAERIKPLLMPVARDIIQRIFTKVKKPNSDNKH